MNTYQKLAYVFFGHQYVQLVVKECGRRRVHRAHPIGGRYYVYPDGDPNDRIALCREGWVEPDTGQYYWIPLTDKVGDLHRGGKDAKTKDPGGKDKKV